MITFRSSPIQNADPPRRLPSRHGAARTNARLRCQIVRRSVSRKANTYARNGLFIHGNIFGQRNHHCRLPLRSFCCAQTP